MVGRCQDSRGQEKLKEERRKIQEEWIGRDETGGKGAKERGNGQSLGMGGNGWAGKIGGSTSQAY